MYKNTELMCIDKTDRCFFQDKVYLILAIANTYLERGLGEGPRRPGSEDLALSK